MIVPDVNLLIYTYTTDARDHGAGDATDRCAQQARKQPADEQQEERAQDIGQVCRRVFQQGGERQAHRILKAFVIHPAPSAADGAVVSSCTPS